MSTEIRIDLTSDKGETELRIERDDEVAAVAEAVGLLIATRAGRLGEVLLATYAVLDAFNTARPSEGDTT